MKWSNWSGVSPVQHPSPSLESFVITSWLLQCAVQLSELLQGDGVRPLKGNYFTDTIRDDSLFDVLPPLHSPPASSPALHPNCSLGSNESVCVCVCVCVCGLVGPSMCFPVCLCVCVVIVSILVCLSESSVSLFLGKLQCLKRL